MGSAHWANNTPAPAKREQRFCYWHGAEPCKHFPDGFRTYNNDHGEPMVVGTAAETIYKGDLVSITEDGRIIRRTP